MVQCNEVTVMVQLLLREANLRSMTMTYLYYSLVAPPEIPRLAMVDFYCANQRGKLITDSAFRHLSDGIAPA